MSVRSRSEYRKSRAHFLLVALVLSWNLCLACGSASAVEPETNVTHDPGYRRVFVPVDSPNEWPIGKELYLPISKDEFTRLIDKNHDHQASHSLATVRLAGATYYAELVQGQVLVGKAELIVQSNSHLPRVLSLSPLNLAITSAFWNHEDSQQAELGIWQRAAEVHELGVLVRQSDTLRLDWQLQAQDSNSSSLEFLLKVPVAVPQILALVLPENHTAELESGEVFRTEDMLGGKTRYWFQLAPVASHPLKVLRQSKTVVKKSLPRLRRSTSYLLDPEGLSFRTSFSLDRNRNASHDLIFDVSSGVKIVSVDINQQAVSWHMDDQAEGSRLVVEPSPSLSPSSLDIRCLAELQFDQAWQLPVIRPREVAWTEGEIRLVVSPKLELRSIVPTQASIQFVEGLSQQQASEEVYRLQEWSDAAQLEILVGRRSSHLRIRTLTAIDVDPQDSENGIAIPNESTAQTITEISCEGRPSYQIEAEVSADWSIESIKSEPNSALGEWHILEENDRKILRIQLNEPVLPGSPLRLEIDSSRVKSGSLLPAFARELSPLRFRFSQSDRSLLLLSSRQRGQMELIHGLDSSRLTVDEINPNDATLLPDLIDGVLLDLAHLDNEAIVELQSRSDRYHAEVNIDVRVLPNSLEHHYQLNISPISGIVSELMVQFDQPLPETAQWEFVGNQGKPRSGVVATRLDLVADETLDTEAAEQPVTYRLQLPVVAEGPFRLQVQFPIPAAETQPCNIIYLPEATDWSGQIVVRGPLEGVGIDDRDRLWTPLARQEAEAGQLPLMPALGCYRLGVHQSKPSRSRPLIVTRTTAKPVDANLFAWVADFQSFHAADGTTIYLATYLLENSGSTGANIQLPQGARLQEAWLDQEYFEPREVLVDDQGKCRFHFDNNRRYPTLAVQYVIHDPALQHSTPLNLPVPTCSFPVSRGRWNLWLPEQYVIADKHQENSSPFTWTQRLFGPLTRAADQSIFNPFHVDSWQPIWSAPLDKLWSTQRATRLSEALLKQLQERNHQQWGPLLLSAAVETATKHLLLVDYSALHEQGIQAATELGWVVDTEELLAGFSTPDVGDSNSLTSKGLALVANAHVILLTTDERTTQWRDLLQRTEKQGIFTVTSKLLNSELMEQANRRLPFPDNETSVVADFLGVDAWIESPTFSDPPWNSHSSNMFAGMGHQAATIEFVDQPSAIVVSLESVQRAHWHVIWLLTLAVCTWFIPQHANKLVLLLGFSAIVCLTVSVAWLVVFQAVFLGLLSAFVLQIPLKKLSWNVPESLSTQLATRAAAVALLLGAILLCSRASAEPNDISADEATAATQNRLHRVFIPVDSERIPQGDDVYLPESFLKELRNASGDSTRDGTQCLLVSALYHGNLPPDPRNTSDADEAWTITLEIQSFVSNCELDLPFRRDEAEWLEDGHRLDGLPVAVTWKQDGDGCSVQLGDTGTHRLELMVRPKVTMISNQARLEMQVPQLPKTRIDFSVPAGISDLKINSSGKIVTDRKTGRWQALRSISNRLQMSWTPTQNGRASDSIGELEQMAWLHVSPSVVQLDVQLRLQHATKLPEKLILEISPQLDHLPLDEESPIVEIKHIQGNPTLLELKLKPDLDAEVILRLKFDLQRQGGPIGHIFYPQIRMQGATTTRSLFAVSVSDGLSYEESLSEEVRSLTATDFASLWGTAGEFPLYAYSLTNHFPKGSLRVWPGPKSMSVQQSMRVHCELKHAHVEYEAAVDEITGNWLTHRLWVPVDFTVKEVSVRDRPEMLPVTVRWSRVNKSQIVLFLERPLHGPHVISLSGQIKVSRDSELTLPAISLVSNERRLVHVVLTREADVQVSWVEEEAPVDLSSKNMVRGRTKIPVGRWSRRASDLKNIETLRIEKNDREFAADTLTTIAQGSTGWTATLHSAIHVQKGVLSQVTLAVPNGFRPPYRIEPAEIGFEGDVQETASGRQLTFLLSKPITARDTFEMHVTGELDLPPDQRLEVPHLLLVDSTHSYQYLQLPTRVGEQQVDWILDGLKSTSLPTNLARFSDSQKNNSSFLVEKTQFSAQEKTYQGPLQIADLRYAIISGTLDRSGTLSATAELVLQPGRATHCILRLPVDAKLKQLVTGNSRARREKVGDRSWRISLGPPFLPRKIKVVYQVEAKMTGQDVRLTPPELMIGDQILPLPQTLWKIDSAGDLSFGNALVGHSLLAEQFARSAHQLPLETLSDARLLALELPIQEGQSWFQPWQHDTQLAWDVWRAHEPLANAVQESSPTLLGISSLAEEKSSVWSALVSKLGNSKTPQLQQTLQANYPPALPRWPYASATGLMDQGAESYFISDQQGQLVLKILSTNGGHLKMWFLVAMIAIGTFAIARFFRGKTDWHASFYHRPHLMAFVGGLLWWLCLAASYVGLLIVLITLASLALRQGRKKRRPQTTETQLMLGTH